MNTEGTKPQGVMLEVHGLRKSYDGVEVLKGLDFEVQPGEIFVIMGPSGSGKSVLLRQLSGLEVPDAGTILINGEPVQSPELVADHRIAMVFQSGALFDSLTVGANVGFYLVEHSQKLPADIARIVAQNLELVGLKGTEDKMPGELSGGMRKRVAIARALVVEPQLILYDEPTSGLDPLSSVEIANVMVNLKNRIQVTTVIVSHDRELAFSIADHIAVIEDGRILAIRTPDELKRDPDPRIQHFLNVHFQHVEAEANVSPALAIS
jgi:phospholipid/cholesterol/gamma-HCH transport system ATP-binding protein